jgi:hypothetical protein
MKSKDNLGKKMNPTLDKVSKVLQDHAKKDGSVVIGMIHVDGQAVMLGGHVSKMQIMAFITECVKEMQIPPDLMATHLRVNSDAEMGIDEIIKGITGVIKMMEDKK